MRVFDNNQVPRPAVAASSGAPRQPAVQQRPVHIRILRRPHRRAAHPAGQEPDSSLRARVPCTRQAVARADRGLRRSWRHCVRELPEAGSAWLSRPLSWPRRRTTWHARGSSPMARPHSLSGRRRVQSSSLRLGLTACRSALQHHLLLARTAPRGRLTATATPPAAQPLLLLTRWPRCAAPVMLPLPALRQHILPPTLHRLLPQPLLLRLRHRQQHHQHHQQEQRPCHRRRSPRLAAQLSH